jgi:hypothetical protein
MHGRDSTRCMHAMGALWTGMTSCYTQKTQSIWMWPIPGAECLLEAKSDLQMQYPRSAPQVAHGV